MKGRVAVLQKYGGDFDLREYPVPDPEPGAVLVRLTHAGICGSDLHIWRGEMKGLYGETPKDLTFGHEMCGRVERLGAGVTTDSLGAPLREGDRVTYCYFFPCGRCPVCLQDEMGACPRKGRANRVAGTPPYFNNAYGDYYYLPPGHFIFRLPAGHPAVIATPGSASATRWWCRGRAGSASTRWRWPATWGRTRYWWSTASRSGWRSRGTSARITRSRCGSSTRRSGASRR